ncbi:pentapeptide repeat-containing protein [Williamsia sterculiae]|uniref:Pentapeptide repeat-containing protein n=1 Tax=Williamsia sterculiae TaxID=1344003 RepID=A0A1N7HDZ6_9NOCA|nr:pentapeptide repeat-containing protein [Williamsia sterculiae]SIS23052.1 Pentapeptide repeat-containing protein [Williamsia sterculiae]
MNTTGPDQKLTPRTGPRWLRRPGPAISGILALVYVGPPALYAATTSRIRFGDFYSDAASAYGAITAGLLAVTAAGMALYNGQQQLKQADKQLTATLTAADREHDATIVRDLRARFTTATEQLAHTTHTIQQAGAYSLASLADDWLTRNTQQEAQVCIDVLCTYLRTHHLTGLDDPDTYNYTQTPPDQTVRDTIIRIIANHTRGPRDDTYNTTPGPWSNLSFDLTGAHLHDPDLSNAHLNAAKFTNVRFSGDEVSFTGAEFSGGEVSFTEAEFSGGQVSFGGARFSGGEVSFGGARFSGGRVYFTEARFSGGRVQFTEARFSGGRVQFTEARFSGGRVSFAGARFSGGRVSFSRARFSGGEVSFTEAEFSGGEVSFARPLEWRNITFDWDNDLSQKPANVLPKDWPPQLYSQNSIARSGATTQ